MMQGLELFNPSLVASTDLLPARELPSSPPTPPGPSHHFPEPEDTTGQARMRSTTGTGVRVGPRVFCSILPASATITGSAPIQVCTNNNYFLIIFIF